MPGKNRYSHIASGGNDLLGTIGQGFFIETTKGYKTGCLLKRVDIYLGVGGNKEYTIEIVGPQGDILISTQPGPNTSATWAIYTPPTDGGIELYKGDIIRVITSGASENARATVHVESR